MERKGNYYVCRLLIWDREGSEERRGENMLQPDKLIYIYHITDICAFNVQDSKNFIYPKRVIQNCVTSFHPPHSSSQSLALQVGSPAGQLLHPNNTLTLLSFSLFLLLPMSAHPMGLQVSGPADWDKATINCRAEQRARWTKDPTRCPCPQTRTETNVTGLAQNGIIRPVSLNTFTYLRALSAFCFVLAQEERRAGMEKEEDGRIGGECVCVCVCMQRERRHKGGREVNE